jgi:hypothetical protein
MGKIGRIGEESKDQFHGEGKPLASLEALDHGMMVTAPVGLRVGTSVSNRIP